MSALSSLLDRFANLMRTGAAPVPQGDSFTSTGGVYNNGALLDLLSGNGEAAFRVSAFLCGVRAIAEGLAQIPCGLRREIRAPDGSRRFEWHTDDPRHFMLSRCPNEVMTSFEWREMMVLQAVTKGVGRAAVFRDTEGRPTEIFPLLPGWCSMHRSRFESARYQITIDGTEILPAHRPAEDYWRREDIIELKGPSWNTWEALDLSRLAAAALGLSADLEKSATLGAARRGGVSGFIGTELNLSRERTDNLRNNFAEALQAGHHPILDSGAKFHQMQMSAEQRQELENRKFQIEEIGRMLRVFPQMLMMSDATNTNATAGEVFAAHVTHTLMPWITRFEEAVSLTLLTEEEQRSGLRVDLDPAGLMRGSMATQGEYYTRALGNGNNGVGWMTDDEVRAQLGFNPLTEAERTRMRAWAAPPRRPEDQSKSTRLAAAQTGGDDAREITGA